MALELSLYALESQLSELIEMREATADSLREACSKDLDPEHAKDAERLEEELAVIDNAIQEYITAEIRKVDGIRAFWRHCDLMAAAAKEEAELQAARSKAWRSRLDRLKQTVQLVMETIPFPAGKPRKLEGRTGALLLKSNGGRPAVEISDESLIPDEFCVKTITLTPLVWQEILNAVCDSPQANRVWPLVRDGAKESARAPSLSLIAEQLSRNCEHCDGAPAVGTKDECQWCGGTGKQSVPGARFAPAGSHVECK